MDARSEASPDSREDARATAPDPDARETRILLATIAKFVETYVPAANQSHDAASTRDDSLVDRRVIFARDQALIAAFERIGRICRGDVDRPALLEDEA